MLVVAGCSQGGGITVEDSWARPTPPVADSAALYVSLANGGEEDSLVGASSQTCGVAMLHDTVVNGDVMEMRHIEERSLPSAGTLRMEPGGLHIMCLQLTEPLAAGDMVEVTLSFTGAGELTVVVPVEDR